MNIHHLQTFMKIVEFGSFTRAAEALHLTQPAVTQHIKALEDELEEQLFGRSSGGIWLTDAGHILVDYTRRILELESECKEVIRDLNPRRGRLRLGAGLTLSIFILPPLLVTFQQRQNEVEVVVRTGTTREVVALVLDNSVDMAIVSDPSPHHALEITHLMDDEMILVVGPNHRWVERGAVGAVDLAQEPLIFFEQGSGYRTFVEFVFRQLGVPPYIHMELDSIEAMKRMVEVGLGATIIPRSSAKEELKTGLLTQIEIEGAPSMLRPVCAVYRSGKYVSAPMRAFIQVLEEKFHDKASAGGAPAGKGTPTAPEPPAAKGKRTGKTRSERN